MKVFVRNKEGKPLMPTTPRKARVLLKEKKAKVVKREPFTIQLLNGSSGYVQSVTVGIDAGYGTVGFSAVNDKQELFGGELELMKGMSNRLSTKTGKGMYRRNRRGRLRYRAPRFDNRCGQKMENKKKVGKRQVSRDVIVINKHGEKLADTTRKNADKFIFQGRAIVLEDKPLTIKLIDSNVSIRSKRKQKWLAPSIQHKLDSHINLIDIIKFILPVDKVIIETANFDIQKIKNPAIEGAEYQQGEQWGFWNLREYVLHRDGHQCQLCKKKSKSLSVHHIGYWKKDESDRPGNLITLCTDCHTKTNHNPGGVLWGWKPKVKSFKDATFMSTVRKMLVQKTGAEFTYGFITKTNRIELGLDKSHHNDAFVIAGGKEQERCEPTLAEQIRRNNRSLSSFVDAMYIDIRTGKKEKGSSLFNGRTKRNKNTNTENLRVYRGQKVRSGKVRVRTQRYDLQKGDIILFEGKKYRCGGTSSHGKSVYVGDIGVKSAKKVTVVGKRKGMFVVVRCKHLN